MDYDRIHDRELTRHLGAMYGDPVPDEDPDLVADERSQLILDALNSKDWPRIERLMNGARK